jgi:hypothetical protein
MEPENPGTGYAALLDRLFDQDPYDPNCTRVEVALKAIWLLYVRRKWDLLAGLGLEKAEFEPLFTKFDNDYVLHVRLRDAVQAAQLVRFVYRWNRAATIKLLSACFWMVAEYTAIKKHRRNYHR